MAASAVPPGPIRTVVIGFGTSGAIFHAPFLDANPDYSLDVIVTGDPGRRAEAEVQYPDARVVPTVDEALALGDRLDLVVVGSPTGTHAGLAARALDAGLHVVVDKPLAVTAAEGRMLVERASNAGRILTVFQNRRWDDDFLTLRRLLDEGALGDVTRFESRFEWWKPEPADSWKTRATASTGGGLLYDLGTHVIDQALQLFGDVDEVNAEVDIRRPGGVADDDVFVSLLHHSGVRSHLWMSSVAAQPGPRFRVLGSIGAYVSWELDGQESALIAGARPSDPGFGRRAEWDWGTLGIEGSLTTPPMEPGDYAAFTRALADTIRRGAPVPVNPDDAIRVLEIIESIHSATADNVHAHHAQKRESV
jgi:scyllo-inositol 2-dehydrogenase (NADP+)